jgi:alpha-glucosidase
MLTLYRDALRIRRAEPGLGDGPMTWFPAGDDVLAFHRGPQFACVVNLSARPVPLPAHDAVLLTSGPLAGPDLPTDTAAWLRTTAAAPKQHEH